MTRMLLALFVAVAASAPAAMQASAQSASDGYAQIANLKASEAAERAHVRDVLSEPGVRAVAAEAGLDIEDAESAVGLLDGATLATAADLASQIQAQLAGGQERVSIRTTTLIIILLLVIIVILID